MKTKKKATDRVMTILVSLVMLLAGFTLVAPATTAQVCLLNQPCLETLACSNPVVESQTNDGGDPGDADVVTTACLALATCNGTYTVIVDVQQMGPRDSVTGWVSCGGDSVASCSVTFADILTGWSCSDSSDPVSGGALECGADAYERSDGVEVQYTISCAEPPLFPEW